MVVMTPCMSESFLVTFRCLPSISTRELTESTAAELSGAWHHGAGPRQAACQTEGFSHLVPGPRCHRSSFSCHRDRAGEVQAAYSHCVISASPQQRGFLHNCLSPGCWSGCFLKHICPIKNIFKNLRNKGVLPRLHCLPGSDLSQVPLFSHHLQHRKAAPEEHKTHYSLELHVHGRGFWCQNLPLSPLVHSTGWFK